MKTLNRRDFPGAQYPERIIQFGEGNFLRAFVDWQIDLLNEHTDLNSGVVVVRPIETSFPPSLSTQDGLYIRLQIPVVKEATALGCAFLNPPFYPRSRISQRLSRRADKMCFQIDFILTKG